MLGALRDSYCAVVGLAVGERPPFRSRGYSLYAGGRDLLHLTEAAPDEQRRADTTTTFDYMAFECHDRAAFERLLAQRGLAYERARPADGAGAAVSA